MGGAGEICSGLGEIVPGRCNSAGLLTPKNLVNTRRSQRYPRSNNNNNTCKTSVPCREHNRCIYTCRARTLHGFAINGDKQGSGEGPGVYGPGVRGQGRRERDTGERYRTRGGDRPPTACLYGPYRKSSSRRPARVGASGRDRRSIIENPYRTLFHTYGRVCTTGMCLVTVARSKSREYDNNNNDEKLFANKLYVTRSQYGQARIKGGEGRGDHGPRKFGIDKGPRNVSTSYFFFRSNSDYDNYCSHIGR